MNETNWITAFLQDLGITPSQENVNWVSQWIAAEGPFGTQANPLNISVGNADASLYNDPAAAANWLMNNGNFNGIGTYGQNLRNYLNGAVNNLQSSLSWFSGHSGGPISPSSSTFYSKLPGTSATQWTGNIGSTVSSAASNALKTAIPPLGFLSPDWLNNAGANIGWLLVALTLLLGGIIWLAISQLGTDNSATNKTIRATTKTAKAVGMVE